MGNHAYVSIFIDQRGGDFLTRMRLPVWARRASEKKRDIVFPDVETTERLFGGQLIDTLDLMPLPADQDGDDGDEAGLEGGEGEGLEEEDDG